MRSGRVPHGSGTRDSETAPGRTHAANARIENGVLSRGRESACRSDERMVFHTIKKAALAAALTASLLAGAAACAMDINLPEGVTPASHEVYDLHMMVFWVCVGIAVVVFGAMLIAIFRFRHAAGAKAAQFHESTAIEIAWTIVPVIILVAMAIPAAKVLVRMSDASDPDMSIKITGYQWKW